MMSFNLKEEIKKKDIEENLEHMETFIKETIKKIEKLSAMYMSIEEAKLRREDIH